MSSEHPLGSEELAEVRDELLAAIDVAAGLISLVASEHLRLSDQPQSADVDPDDLARLRRLAAILAARAALIKAVLAGDDSEPL